MATIKNMVQRKLQEKGRSTEDFTIRDYVRSALTKACELLPRGLEDSDSELNHEFVKFMFESHKTTDRQAQIELLVGMAMNEQDDLGKYKAIRQALVDELGKRL